MDFFDITSEKACAVNIPAKTRDEVLWDIACRAAAVPAMKELTEKDIYHHLRTREEQGSTGFGKGVAIPHARLPEVHDFVVFVVTSARGVEYNALDRKRVNVFFVILGPEKKVREHLQIIAAISNVITHSNIKKELLAATTGTVLREIFLSKVQEHDREVEREKMKLLLMVLYEEHYFYDILEYFIQEGVEGATIFDSSGMGRYISNIPLFASFIGFMNEQKNHSRTIMATIRESRVGNIVQGIERITGNLDYRQGAMIMILDVGLCKGTMRML